VGSEAAAPIPIHILECPVLERKSHSWTTDFSLTSARFLTACPTQSLRRMCPELAELAGLFYGGLSELGAFQEVLPGKLPPPYGELLDHDNHMTETVERYLGGLVGVQVLDKLLDQHHYARKILLAGPGERIIQFGIMRVNFAYMDRGVRREIESERWPLGRILVEHNVHRRVQRCALWRVECGVDLQRWFGSTAQTTYGRTALIECNHEPAIELVEILAPGLT